MSRQMRRAAERAALKNPPPTIGPRGVRMQEAATAFQSAMQQVSVAENMLSQFNRLVQEMAEDKVEDLIELAPGLEEKLKQRLQIARVGAIDAGIALIGLPGDAPSIVEPTDEEVAAANAEKIRQLEVEEARS